MRALLQNDAKITPHVIELTKRIHSSTNIDGKISNPSEHFYYYYHCRPLFIATEPRAGKNGNVYRCLHLRQTKNCFKQVCCGDWRATTQAMLACCARCWWTTSRSRLAKHTSWPPTTYTHISTSNVVSFLLDINDVLLFSATCVFERQLYRMHGLLW